MVVGWYQVDADGALAAGELAAGALTGVEMTTGIVTVPGAVTG
jgi:hypothetical protein